MNGTIEQELEAALAEAGRIIEAMPWDWRHDRSRNVLLKLGLFTDDAVGTAAAEFVTGVLVHAHSRRMDDSDPAALRACADALIAKASRIEGENCTGLSALWCPVHGECTCPETEDARDDDDCPLHSPRSAHGG